MWLQLSYIIFGEFIHVLLFILLIIMGVLFLLPIKLAVVKVFIFIVQMGLSIAGVSVGSYVVADVLHHLLIIW